MKDLIELVMQRKNITQKELCDILGISYTTIKRLKGTMTTGTTSSVMKEKIRQKLEELVDAPIETQDQYDLRIERQNFRLQERNKLLNKENRNLKKSEFTLQEFYDSILEQIDRISSKVVEPLKCNFDTKKDKSLIVGLSDLHFGGTVNLQTNVYNIEVAKRRLMEYADIAIETAVKNNVSEIIVSTLGDLFCLTTKREMLLKIQDTRAEAFIDGLDIMRMFLDKMLSVGVKVRVIGVLGNESRLDGYERPSNCNEQAVDNFDFMLHQCLKRMYKLVDLIEFENECNTLDFKFEVQGKNIVALHGNTIKHDEKGINNFRMNCLLEYGVLPDMLIFGHIHNPWISSFHCRLGSIKGSDEYSKNGLNLPINKPSQTMMVVDKDRIIPMIIDLK